ncbi:DUF6074 family protein [Kumtagia ephedrae]|jgi:hypothetical protein|uniref:Uncharacterized protein n=1 Tax=Kumtagia ephedrae TaxID=2116701 RepID=A0A2P7SDY8_9HYPH|nr:DUF6074 family protein [Mesorhizobium ephedrae]PSJ60575.1 hypothetical protein C7I84_11415 [Mesorhizobium ephedrae]
MHEQTAELIAFPIDRRMALVKRAAGELSALSGEAANGYWRATARRLLQELTEQGRDMDAARREVLRFFEAVQAEFRKELAQRRSSASA